MFFKLNLIFLQFVFLPTATITAQGKYFSLIKDGSRQSSSVLAEYMLQSELDCFLRCANHATCNAVNIFNQLDAIDTRTGAVQLGLTTLFRIRHNGGRCMTYDTIAKHFVLSRNCTDFFSFTANMNLLHANTSKCLAPDSSNNYLIQLTSPCTEQTIFKALPSNSLMHVLTGKCLRPKHGYPFPKEGKQLILRSQCEGAGMQFFIEQRNFIKCQLVAKNRTEDGGTSFNAQLHWKYYEQL